MNVRRLREQRGLDDALTTLAAAGIAKKKTKAADDEATEVLKAAVLDAVAAGATIRKTAEFGQLAPDTVNRWVQAAAKDAATKDT